MSYRSFARSSSGKFCSAHRSNATRALLSDSPNELKRYVTCGGMVCSSSRMTSPLRSNVRSVWVSIFWDMPSIRRSKAPLRIGPSARADKISIAHLSAISSSACRAEQLESKTLGLFFGSDRSGPLVTWKCVLVPKCSSLMSSRLAHYAR